MSIQIEIIKFIQTFSNELLDKIFTIVTMFGEETLLVVFASIVFLSVDKKKGYKLIFTLASGTCINSLIKNIVKFERPIGVDGIISKRIETATGYSFPSGHTQASSTFWSSATIIFKRKWLYIFTPIIIILTALSRLYLGVHWPTDVIFGALIGLLWAMIIDKVFDYIEKNKAYTIPIVASVLFCILAILFKESDFYKTSGLLLGLSIGYMIEDKYIDFSINMSLKNKIISYILLLGGLLLIKGVLKLLFPTALIFNILRYFIVGLWAFGIAPFIIKKLN